VTTGMTPQDMHPAFEAAFNRQDLEGLVALYAPDAVMARPDGSLATGLDAVRQELSGVLGTNGQMTMRTRYVMEAGDLALLSSEWTLTAGDQTMSAVSTEVARRQPGGGWLYVLDSPFGSLEPDEAAKSGSAAASSGSYGEDR
jgi:ketosteroid isomerase-like protein